MSGPYESGTAIALPGAMKRYRLIEVGCSRELYAIAEDSTDERRGDTVARFTVGDEERAEWMLGTLRAFRSAENGAHPPGSEIIARELNVAAH